MTLALVGTALLAILVFAFVLEPLLRARPDEIVVDAVALPDVVDDELADNGPDPDEILEESPPMAEERPAAGRVVDRTLGGDLT